MKRCRCRNLFRLKIRLLLSSILQTYNLDRQTPDSAGTATAFLCGAKAKYGVIGLDGRAETGVCEGSNSYRLTSMLDWSIAASK